MSVTGTARAPHLRELGEFFRTRRGEIEPEVLGIETGGTRRRVSGLRREEVAEAALISSDYYTRIEQGRLAPSPSVLESIVQVLQLDDDQLEYVLSLLEHAALAAAQAEAPGVASARSGAGARGERQRVRPQLQLLLDQLTELPALVLGPRTELLAWNSLAEQVYVPFSEIPRAKLNYSRLVFTDQRMRELFEDWPSVARSCVAILRREAAANPEDPALSALVGELTIADRDFGRWWAARNVTRQDIGTKVLLHPIVGALTLDWDTFRYASSPEQQLIVNSPKAGTGSAERLARLLG